jgi:glucose/arabinose dehydrogenase
MARPTAALRSTPITRPLVAATLAAALAACAGNGAAPATTGGSAGGEVARDASGAPCTPLETRGANAGDQRPAFAGQTRACAAPSNAALDVTVVARGLERPWAVEPLPDGSLLVTEKPGRLRIVSAAGQLGEPIEGLPRVDARGQGGLLDVALSPGFATDRTIFWSFSEPREGGNGTALARGTLSADGRRLEQVRVLFRVQPTYDGTLHYGSRVLVGPDGMLYATFGDRSDTPMRPQAQRLDSHLGKIVRIAPDGSVPRDNPFVGRQGALPEIWSLGHRNVQAAAFDDRGRLWEIEHGTRGGDELNHVRKGANYGWPVAAYGIEYRGGQITSALGPAATQREGTVQPTYYWDPVIAPSGAQYYTGAAFPAWRNSLFVGGLGVKALVRLRMDGERVVGEEHLLADRNKRVRDVRQDGRGLLWVVTDDGELWRIAPRG